LDWSDQGVEGCHRFLRRIWRLVLDCREQFVAGPGSDVFGASEESLERNVHEVIKKVTSDIQERFNFNTAISAIMELVNAAYAYRQAAAVEEQNQALLKDTLQKIILLLAPFAPHLAEESWHLLDQPGSVHRQSWPEFDPAKLVLEEVEIVVQINGKVRGRVTVPADCTEEELVQFAKSSERVGQLLEGKEIVKVIPVPGRLVNIVVR
jgi:leucyl-tRNA synthetase